MAHGILPLSIGGMNRCIEFRGGWSWMGLVKRRLCLPNKARKAPTRMPWLFGRWALPHLHMLQILFGQNFCCLVIFRFFLFFFCFLNKWICSSCCCFSSQLNCSAIICSFDGIYSWFINLISRYSCSFFNSYLILIVCLYVVQRCIQLEEILQEKAARLSAVSLVFLPGYYPIFQLPH